VCCIKTAVLEISEVIKVARMKAQGNTDFAVVFKPEIGRVALLSDKGPDGAWNTDDDEVVRSFTLPGKGAGLKFGYGTYGPVPDKAEDKDNDGIVSSPPRRIVCNTDLTGNGGSIYLITRSGIAMAIVVNSQDFGWKIWRWEGTTWVLQ
jgi:hypothetical protein